MPNPLKNKADIEITASTTNLKAQLKKAGGLFKKSFDGIAKSTKKSGKSITAGFNAIASSAKRAAKGVALLAAPVLFVAKAYADYQTALIGVAKTLNLSTEEAKAFGKEIKEIGKDIPVSTNEMLKFAQLGAQFGVANKDLSKFSVTLARLKASAEDLDIEDAAKSIAKSLNLLEGSNKNVDRFASSVAKLGDTFAISEGEILHSTLRITSAVAKYDVSADQALALGTATKVVGIEAERAQGLMSRSFAKIQDAIFGGGEALEELIRLTGKSGEQLKKEFGEDAVGVFADYIKGLKDVPQEDFNKSLAKLGLTAQRTKTDLGLLASKGYDTLTDALKTAKKEYKENTKLTQESDKAFASLGNQAKAVWKSIVDLTTTLGEKLSPVFKEVTKGALEFIRSLGTEENIKKIANAIKTVFDKLKEIRDSDYLKLLTENFRILWSVGVDLVGVLVWVSNGIFELGKSLLGGQGNFDKFLEKWTMFRKLLENDKFLKVAGLAFKNLAVDINSTFKKIGFIFDFGVLKIKGFISEFKGNFTKLKAIANIVLNDIKNAIKIGALKIARETEILAKTTANIEAISGKSDADIKKEIEGRYAVRISALNSETDKLNKAVFENANKTLQAEKDALKIQSEALLQDFRKIKAEEEAKKQALRDELTQDLKESGIIPTEGETDGIPTPTDKSAPPDEGEDAPKKTPLEVLTDDPSKTQENVDANSGIITEGYQNTLDGVNEAKEGMAEDEGEDDEKQGGFFTGLLDSLFGSPEKTQENIDANKDIIADGMSGVLDNVKNFFGLGKKEGEKDTKNKADKSKKDLEILDKFNTGELVSNAEKVAGLLGQQEAFGKVSKALGKAESIASIVQTTPEAAMNSFNAFASLPIVGPALGFAAAAATVAYGATQIAAVGKAQQGGIVPGIGSGDKVPMMLEAGERVIPAQIRPTFDEAVRGGGFDDVLGKGRGGETAIDITFHPEEFADMFTAEVTTRQRENDVLGL